MIPADLANRLRTVTQDLPAPVQPTVPAKRLTDVLSELSAGQKIMAEIQALLPNGMYRAVVSQREITLALPFSAKPGDSLELEVVDNDGQLTLALATPRSGSQSQTSNGESVPTTLSRTGSLIGNLLSEIEQQGGQARPAPLNANSPLADVFPATGKELAPVLREALVKSGMFYEAHQARWVEGKLEINKLLQEPQGKLSPALSFPQQGGAMPPSTSHPAQVTPSIALTSPPEAKGVATPHLLAPSSQDAPAPAVLIAHETRNEAKQALAAEAHRPSSGGEGNLPRGVLEGTGNPIHPETAPLVQQQLNALASQTYVWQGQIWPGQNMQWEIAEDGQRHADDQNSDNHHWRTSLRLVLPLLGAVDARIRIDAQSRLAISISTASEESKNQLQMAAEQLNNALEAAGLSVTGFSISHDQTVDRENS